MKHANEIDLVKINEFIMKIREYKQIKENKYGHFYYKGRSVVHFHVDKDGIYFFH